MTNTTSNDKTGFSDLGISQDLVKSMKCNNIIEPTKVQQQVIPIIKEGKDLLCQSETGSGKTISFAIPIIDRLERKGGARVLVVAPTRELAKQIAEEFEKFGSHKRLKTITIYGGVSMGPQIDSIATADIVVGTPGRILDLYRQGHLKLELVDHLVLDECDRMFDMGFINDVEDIIYATKKDRQVLLFSATVSSTVKELSSKYMRDPEHIRVTPHLVKGHLEQQYYVVAHNQKISLIVHLLKTQKYPEDRVIIFCRTKRLVDMVTRALQQNNFKADALHGDLSQARRERVIQNFGQGKTQIVVATDVASRGIHVDDVRYVYNYNLPEETETFVHRVGRTARNGKPGDAITLLSEDEFRLFDDVMHHYNGDIEKCEAGQVPKVMFRKEEPQARGGQRGGFSRGGQRGAPSRFGESRGRSGARSGGFSRGGSRDGGARTMSGQRSGGRPGTSQRSYKPRQDSGRAQHSGGSLADLD